MLAWYQNADYFHGILLLPCYALTKAAFIFEINRPQDYWTFFNAQLSMKFIMLINVKMPTTIVGILIFISMINTASKSLKAKKSFFSNLVFMSN